jgi:hypothetical protein
MSRAKTNSIIWCAVVVTVVFNVLLAARTTVVAEPPVATFEKTIAPILIRRCVACHNGRRAEGKLNLTTHASILKGGEEGPAVVPGDLDKSYLIERIRDGEMPPKGKGTPPTAKEIKQLEAWVKGGASWPKDRRLSAFEITTDQRAGYDWWSLQPLRDVAVPKTSGLAGRNPIDAFVRARLAKSGLTPSPPAERVALLRRLKFDLLGLPPTPDEVDAFVKDKSAGAYERLVDRFLASPHYGERWGRFWLDIAHYADTHGFERDQRRDNAWRYRDYVIDALNTDKPYDQFIREQIAGDILYPDRAEAVIATGFLAAGPFDFVGQIETASPLLRKQARADDLDDMVTTVITSTMGLTVNCARCHDHKIDPISQADYYGLWAVFAGVKRADRDANPQWKKKRAAEFAVIDRRLAEINNELARVEGTPLSLADMVGGGNGFGTGRKGHGINPVDGRSTKASAMKLNVRSFDRFVPAENKLVDGVFVPSGKKPVIVTTTGIVVKDLPKSSGNVWDYFVNGTSRGGTSAKIGGIDYNASGHSTLGMHANKGITFDLAAIRKASGWKRMKLRAVAGYGGAKGAFTADLRVYLDGRKTHEIIGLAAANQGQEIELALTPSDRFLTFVATDGGNDFSHDQVFLGDPRLVRDPSEQSDIVAIPKERLEKLRQERNRLTAQRSKVPGESRVYAAVPQKAPPIHVLRRGNVQQPLEAVVPSSLSCLPKLPAKLTSKDAPEGQRRAALARWITSPDNPLVARVMVNRLWHYHFGTGIVATPSDFGFFGDRPSHPELLDWLAVQLKENGWSLKHIHRLIVMSETFRQASTYRVKAARVDSGNRLLWRFAPKRLEAEATRDAMLAVAGNLNLTAGGPGFWEFKYKEEYAPVYTYVTPTKPEQWRRSVYRFVVRTTRNPLMKVLDCPNPAVLTPVRNRTTTAAQSLALLNNGFVIQQAKIFAKRLQRERPDDVAKQIELGYRLAFNRGASNAERSASKKVVIDHGLFYFCRVLLNANEFVYLD